MSENLDDPYFEVCCDDFDWLSRKRDGWQFGEQGLIDAIVNRITPSLRVAIEIGAGDGCALPLTCSRLLHRGWKVIGYESEERSRLKLASMYPELDARGEYIFERIPDCSVLIIDIDSADSIVMATALESCIPNLCVVEHYDKAGPYVTAGKHSFDEPVPEWLLGMPLGIPEGRWFTIQSPSEHLDDIAAAHGMIPVCRTRINSFYVPHTIAEELRNV